MLEYISKSWANHINSLGRCNCRVLFRIIKTFIFKEANQKKCSEYQIDKIKLANVDTCFTRLVTVYGEWFSHTKYYFKEYLILCHLVTRNEAHQVGAEDLKHLKVPDKWYFHTKRIYTYNCRRVQFVLLPLQSQIAYQTSYCWAKLSNPDASTIQT